jgi:hypothetical protein
MFMEVLRSTEAPMVAGLKKVSASETGKEKLPVFPHSVYPVTAVSPEMLQQGDAIICEDQYIKTQQLH